MRVRSIKKSFYLNEEENKRLKLKCIKTGLSESNFFRLCILDENIKEKPDEKFFDTLDNLRGIATNINQIARGVNTGGYIDTDDLKILETEVKNIIKDLRNKYL